MLGGEIVDFAKQLQLFERESVVEQAVVIGVLGRETGQEDFPAERNFVFFQIVDVLDQIRRIVGRPLG